MSKIFIQRDGKWIEVEPIKNLIFVIGPGAGCYSNRSAYQYLENNYKLEYFCKPEKNRHSKYDNYPENWGNNSFVSNEGYHLGGIANLIKDFINGNYIPMAIICGSRGGQVTIGKVWESIWRGPSVIINAGCLTTKTFIPKEVSVSFIIMEKDYFKSVNNINKVKSLFTHLKETDMNKGKVFFLPNHLHMPNLKGNLIPLLSIIVDDIVKKRIIADVTRKDLIVKTLSV